MGQEFGLLSLAGLFVLYAVLISLRHEGLKSLPGAIVLVAGAALVTRITLLELLPRVPAVRGLGLAPVIVDSQTVVPITALMVLVVALSGWFGAPPATWVPQPFYEGDRHGSAGVIETLEDLEALNDHRRAWREPRSLRGLGRRFMAWLTGRTVPSSR